MHLILSKFMRIIPSARSLKRKKLVIVKKDFSEYVRKNFSGDISKKDFPEYERNINYQFFLMDNKEARNHVRTINPAYKKNISITIRNWPKIYANQQTQKIEKLGYMDFRLDPYLNTGGLVTEATAYYPKGKIYGGDDVLILPEYNIKCLGYYLEAICLSNLIKNDGVVAVSSSAVLLDGRKNQLFNKHIQLEYLKDYPARDWMLALGRGIRHAGELSAKPQKAPA